MLVERRKIAEIHRGMCATSQVVEEVIGAFLPSDVVATHVLCLIKDQQQALVPELPQYFIDHSEVERVDLSGFFRCWHCGDLGA